MDVILVAGLNDVIRGANLVMLKEALLTFKHNVLNRDDSSTFAMATTYLPPKLCKLETEEDDVIEGGCSQWGSMSLHRGTFASRTAAEGRPLQAHTKETGLSSQERERESFLWGRRVEDIANQPLS